MVRFCKLYFFLLLVTLLFVFIGYSLSYLDYSNVYSCTPLESFCVLNEFQAYVVICICLFTGYVFFMSQMVSDITSLDEDKNLYRWFR